MINITSHSASPTLTVVANSSDTLRFLSDQVGKLIDATVIEVTAVKNRTSSAELASTASNSKPQQATANHSAAETGRPTAAGSEKRGESNATSYLLTLRVGDTTINVRSELAPRLNQLVQLQVLNSKQLQFVPPQSGRQAQVNATTNPGTANARAIQPLTNQQQTGSSPALSNASASGTGTTSLSANSLLPQLQTNSNLNATKDAAISAIEQSLRTLLPRQTARTEILTQIRSLLSSAGIAAGASAEATTRTSPSAVQLPAGVSNAIRAYANSISQYSALSTPDGVKQAFLNSGLSLENKLANALPIGQAGSRLDTLSPGASAASVSAKNPANITKPEAVNSGRQTAQARTDVRQAVAGDQKVALGRVIEAIRSHLASSAGSSTKGTERPTAGSPNAEQLLQPGLPLASLWALMDPSSRARANDSNDDNELIAQLLRLVIGLNARTQTNQLVSLASQLGATSDSQLNQGWLFELPLWLNGQLQIVDVKLEQQRAQQSARDINKLWNVRLKFDLESAGELLAFASLRGKTVAASLWASSEKTASRIAEELELVADHLSSQGLTVHSMSCQAGTPDEPRYSGTLNLLDTLT